MQIWAVNTLGGYMYSDNLSQYLRTALQPLARFRQFCDIKDGIGHGKGDTYRWNTYSDIVGDTAGEDAELDETKTMPEDNFVITQGQLTVTEYGRSVPYTKKLDDLSEHPVKEVIQKVLKNHARKALDRAAYTQFNSTVLTVAPVGGNDASAVEVQVSSSGTTITNNVGMSKEHVKSIADAMKERDITPFMDSDYFAIARPTTLRPFKNDLETIHQYTDTGLNLIFYGEIGRYEGIRFVEQTNIASEGWTNAMSDAVFFFGGDTVAEAIVEPEQIRGKIPTDYGRSRGIAWYYLGGFGISHNSADGVQNRIMKWDSAS